eukprot:m.123240 g.123240  ORF g.123240 m.123240 type:complete len:426 (+) comp52150_c0_seq2:55-1332(+)
MERRPLRSTLSTLRNWFSFFLLGTINNMSYVVVNSAAKAITQQYNAENLIGLIPYANIALGLFALGVNTFLLIGRSYSLRMVANSCLMVLGLIGVAFSPNFGVALVAIMILGSSSSFGECVLLGYMRLYPSQLMSAWGAGTGVAGIGGASLYLLYSSENLSLRESFLVTLPWVAVYVFAFFLLLDRTDEMVNLKYQALPQDETPTATESATMSVQGQHDGGLETKAQRYWRCLKLVSFYAFNIGAVYFFEYVISAGCASKVLAVDIDCTTYSSQPVCDSHNSTCEWRTSDNGECVSTSYLPRNSYAIFSFCYQFGVLVSRSSIQFFKIRRVGIVTVLQGINMVLWMLQDYYKVAGLWVLFPLMFVTGLFGGSSYVNIYYLILNTDKIPEKDREMCVNFASISVTLGITLACLFILLIDNTFLASS